MDLLKKTTTVLRNYGEVKAWKDTELNFKVKCDSLNSSCHFIVTTNEINFYYETLLLRVFTSRNTGVLKLAFDCPTKELQWWLEDIKHHNGLVLYSNYSRDTAIIVDQRDITRYRSEGLLESDINAVYLFERDYRAFHSSGTN